MSRIDLLASAGESLAASQNSDPALYLVMFGLVMILIWAVKVAGSALLGLFKAAVAAAVTVLAVTVIPVALLALFLLSAVQRQSGA